MYRKEMIHIFFFYWVPLLCYMILIFYLSHQSKPFGGLIVEPADKVLHFIEFFVFSFLALRAFQGSSLSIIRKHFLFISIIFSIFYAFSDEFHQAFVYNRRSSVLDFCADSLGVLVGSYLFRNNVL